MRKIKFRAWNKKINKMMEVHELSWFTSSACTEKRPSSGKFERQVNDEDGKYSHTDEFTDMFAEDFEIMQYTGLKDKNGKEIYEGDIVKHEYNIRTSLGITLEEKDIQIGKVIFSEDAMAFMIEGFNTHNVFWQKKYGELEVIGNIYENRELFAQAVNSELEDKNE